MKKILVIVVLLAVVVVAGGSWFSRHVGDTVSRRVPAVMSAVVGVPVSLDRFDLNLWRGRATLTGLVVGNAEGFASSRAFSLDRVELELDIGSLLPVALGSGPIGIHSLLVDSPAVFLDIDDNDRTNLQAILERVPGSSVPGAGSGGSQPPEGGGTQPEREPGADTGEDRESDGPRKAAPKIRIGELVMSGASFSVNRAGDEPRTGTLDDIRITEVGGENGVTAVGLSAIVVSRLATQTLEQALELVLRQEAEKAVDRAADKLLDKLRKKLGD